MTLEQAYAFISHSISGGTLGHAYVVVAPPRGAGEVLVKRVLSRLLCQEKEPPCGSCRRCIAVEKGTHPDLHWLEPQKKSRVIGMEQMREFLREMHATSFEGGWKSGIIISADCLNAASANALLKTLEEPTKQTILFLVTDSPQRLLPTINSRCQRVSIEDSFGASASADDCRELIGIISKVGGIGGITGAFGRADRLTAFLKVRKVEIEKEEKRDSKEDPDEDTDKDTLDARVGARYREWRHGILCAMLNWYRDIFLLVCGGDEQYLCFRDDVETLRSAAEGCSYRRALEQIRAVEAAVVQLNRNLSESLTFENVFARLVE